MNGDVSVTVSFLAVAEVGIAAGRSGPRRTLLIPTDALAHTSFHKKAGC